MARRRRVWIGAEWMAPMAPMAASMSSMVAQEGTDVESPSMSPAVTDARTGVVCLTDRLPLVFVVSS